VVTDVAGAGVAGAWHGNTYGVNYAGRWKARCKPSCTETVLSFAVDVLLGVVRGTSMNGEAFAGIIFAGYGSWMFLVFLKFSLVLLGRWVKIVFRGRS
jgi:hypothetical protein